MGAAIGVTREKDHDWWRSTVCRIIPQQQLRATTDGLRVLFDSKARCFCREFWIALLLAAAGSMHEWLLVVLFDSKQRRSAVESSALL